MERIDPSHPQPFRRRILIVMTRRLVAEGMEALFRQLPEWQPLLAANVEEALLCAEQARPEVVFVDLDLPDGGAFLLFHRLRSHWPKLRVAFVDDFVNPARLAAVQSLGASGYFTLADSFGYLAAHLPNLLQGRTVYPLRTGEIVGLSEGGETFLVSSRASSPPVGMESSKRSPSVLSRLSRREIEVLIHLARGLTVKECAELLHLSPNTVDNHKARLMSKLGMHRTVDLVRLAIREKLIDQ